MSAAWEGGGADGHSPFPWAGRTQWAEDPRELEGHVFDPGRSQLALGTGCRN